MARNRWWMVFVFVVAVVAMSGSVVGQSATPLRDDRFTSSGEEWPLVGGDWGNQRYSTLSQINAQNIKNLRGAWISDRLADAATSRAMPVVRDGLMFITTQTRVHALDARTGQTVWSHNPATDDATTAGEVVPGEPGFEAVTGFRIAVMKGGQIVPNTQGVAVAEGLVFVGLYGGEVIALREKTGERVWRQQVGDDPPARGQGISAAVSYANGVVFTGTVNGDFGNRTRAAALDAATGRILWRFYVVPGPGGPGHETWPQDSENWKIGGGGIWKVAAIDQDLGLVYYGTGNAFPGYAGELRAGDNLYTSSVLALEMLTGKLRWHRQLIHHDLWEGDMRQPLVLYDIEMDGRTRKAIGALRTDGYYFIFDRETGEPLIPIEERPVPQDRTVNTAPTQPYPVGIKRMVPDCTEWDGVVPAEWKAAAPPGFQFRCSDFVPPSPNITMPQYVMPGGSTGTAPMSYSPKTGYLYMFASGGSFRWRTRRAPDPNFFGAGSSVRIPGRRPAGLNLLGALDGRTGEVVWKKDARRIALGLGGTLVTASGLLIYTVPADGTLEMVDASTGDLLFAMPTGASPGSGGGAPTTYEIDGEQYVAVAWGPEVRAFKLGGTLPMAAVSPRAASAPETSGTESREFSGRIQDTDAIEVATLIQDLGNNGGTRYFVDEYAFNPYRARVEVGERVVFGNNGTVTHTVVALDGSWTTGPIIAAQNVALLFHTAGNYGYYCKDHPWSYGQVIVENAEAETRGNAAFPDTQVARGQAEYNERCSQCHGGNLGGIGTTPALIGGAFMGHWNASSIGDLFGLTRTTMPQGSPGSLADQTYLDILAFVLRANEFSGPSDELRTDSESLAIRIGLDS